MAKLKELIVPAILSIAFILLTAAGASGMMGFGRLMDLCFYFHLIPFGIGFAGGGGIVILIYYVVLWLVLAVLLLGLRRLYVLIFKRSA